MPPAVEAQSPNHCTAGEFQELFFFFFKNYVLFSGLAEDISQGQLSWWLRW